MLDIKYPEIEVQLSGTDSNAFAIMGKITEAMKRADVSSEEIDAFRREAMSGNYDHLLQTCMTWVNIS